MIPPKYSMPRAIPIITAIAIINVFSTERMLITAPFYFLSKCLSFHALYVFLITVHAGFPLGFRVAAAQEGKKLVHAVLKEGFEK